MKTISPERQMILLCESWYPKAEVTAFVEQFGNMDMVCNIRVDTALYRLPSAKIVGKKGHSRKRRNRIALDEIILTQ